jgi:radical SAM protein with 4Fe4S-binding SPASM domain
MSGPKWLPTVHDPQATRRTLLTLIDRERAQRKNAAKDLKTIYLFLTRKCNLGCQHCYINGVGPKAKDLDFNLQTIRLLIEQALPHGLRKVKVSGGEPTMHREFLAVMEYLGSCGLSELVLETNGTLLGEDVLSRLSRIPNLTIFVSLDHIDSNKHDEFRAKIGVYAKTINTLRTLGETKIDSVVTTTAYRDNYRIIPEIIETTLRWGIDRHRTLLNIHPLGNARAHQHNSLTLDECETLINDLLASPHFASRRAYLTLPPALMPPEYLDGVHSCGWGDSVLGILSNGEISMCSASYDDPAMIGGNAFTTPLMDIWRDSAFFEELRGIASGQVKGVCSNCIFYSVCRGVCKMSSWSHYGDKDAPYPLCQEVYNRGQFPTHALVDPERDCTYRPETIPTARSAESTVG